MYQKIMEGMRKELSFDSLLKLFVTALRKGLGFKRAGVFLIEPDGKHVYLAMGTSPKGNFEKNKNKDRFPLRREKGFSPFNDVLHGYKKYFLSNNIPERIPKRIQYRIQVLNNAVVPIEVGKGDIIGALAVDNMNINRPITKSDVSSLMNYATQVGLAIESFWAHEKTLSLALTDPLTGLYNRRFFDQALSQELKRCQRYSRFFSLLLVDIDRFKRINDTYGHASGDGVIQQVATLLRNNLRNLDIVARVGGEEFAVILPETPPNNLPVVVDRLLREMREAKPAPRAMAEKKERVTFSIGMATYRGGNATSNTMLKLADQSLYRAKNGGRNKAGPMNVVQEKLRKNA